MPVTGPLSIKRSIGAERLPDCTAHAPREGCAPSRFLADKKKLSGCWSTGPRFFQFPDPSAGFPPLIRPSSFRVLVLAARSQHTGRSELGNCPDFRPPKMGLSTIH